MDISEFKWTYDRSELIADGIVHGIGLCAALVGVTALIFYATVWSTSGQLAAAWIYGAGLILTLSVSFLYNLYPICRTKWLLRRLDHSAIFVLIAATYTPFLQRGWDDPFLFWMLIGIWAVALLGISIKCLLPGRFDRLAIFLYLAMGWGGVLAAKSLFAALTATTLVLVLIGGIIYSIGIIFHVWERLRFQNAIWHGFVVAGSAVHYSAVLNCISASAVA
ncbi:MULTISPECIES: PAQR family membrane homeostasis protein TrhA [Sinorhizobium]|uniref:DNA-binding protein n=2 Tax=Sinorhizobium TaxID=28105 RepID=A0A2S3YHE8_9HYPH|nr:MULTISPECIES: hemolysin III family protein [Sinorhizobium]AUX75607.1 hemolysin 3-related protein [Sinorhizobium fredii]PDT40572.1 DNA-binding protein [Sinorhizobium sp. FG01]PDT52335.1 DNA-binding protein [Sinorhizobium sp. NG07B]POH26171.1 DNA-binding protein [Sinorhizobium americanum]POH28067.1 DNA-binding protein [Sinorhizobium americanum]